MPVIFQYGSNCDADRLNSPKRLNGAALDLGAAETIEEYEIAFDVWSQGNGCAAGDLVQIPGRHAWGVLSEISSELVYGKDRNGRKTLEQIEGASYEPKSIRVRNNAGQEVEAITFTVKPDARRQGLWTSSKYVAHIVKGLRDHRISEDYIQHVIDVAIQTNQRATATGAAAEQNRLIAALRDPPPTSSDLSR
jgi:hypothetical protein